MAYVAKRKKSLEESLGQIRGYEPAIRPDHYKADLSRALNWYNANWEEKDYRHAAESYLKKMDLKQFSYAVSKAGFLEMRSIGAIGRLIVRGQHVELNHVERLMVDLDALDQKYQKPATSSPSSPTRTMSVQDNIQQAMHTHAAEFDNAIDEYVQTKATSFVAKTYLQTNKVSGVVAKEIGRFYKRTIEELTQAYQGKDADLKQAYQFLTRVEMRRLVGFVQSIIDDCTQQVVSAKVQRAPRLRKAKPASVVVKKVKYLKSFPELKLTSIDPAKILGASELWVYNPTKRKLTVYRAADAAGLGVSGTTLNNFDVKTSETKSIRKPPEFFKSLSSFGKRAMQLAWKSINAKTSTPRPRINEEMLFLAAN